ncbi:indolepyruvate ferredoxin oxidoreductase family protein [Shewanella aestuarii]|uniref:Indolepyruvate ferredoxin oxidoreductase family protein n=1 Tax=Shewanella aestuarii TaxID=1028752 RepID=A0A6G9QLP1_9GAMM|nr:indolepyruvate ferredoxin oxidoreductase family protein [Shewanella aestuarii]QIR14985.1 indolepyruvate ferredoxin oxidoreductase family protein [Shewanella aestuarii]
MTNLKGEIMKEVKLTDKFTINKGRILISGTQALIKLPTLQKLVDEKNGLNTAGFISGYRGSPLGNFDAQLYKSKKLLDQYNLVFQPGINEDLAATAIWGTQQLDNFPGEVTVDGVFSMWYGKGPGTDRCGDIFKHGNFSGTHKNGGVLLVAGDDSPGKSSTVANQSELAMMAGSIPVVYPSNVEEFFEFGLFGWALSRYSGLWCGFKSVNETVEQTATIDIDVDSFEFVTPTGVVQPQRDVHYKPRTYSPMQDEIDVNRFKIPMAQAFARANKIDKTPFLASTKILGIVTAGKSYMDVLRAIELLNLSKQQAEEIGISIYKVGMIYPLEPTGFREFAAGHQQLFFIEEKKEVMEPQAAHLLYNLAERPSMVGKQDLNGNTLLPADVQLEPMSLALSIADRLAELNLLTETIDARCKELQAALGQAANMNPATARSPYFCSGCPHSRSTKLPEGSKATSGIGCHGMALLTNPNTLSASHMGGEGATWYGIAPFTTTKHIFQNLGDGTYYHSGSMGIRGAVASGANITFKILYNDAVAMTGGQSHDGPNTVASIAKQTLAEGVKKVVIVTDKPELHRADNAIPSNVEIKHRSLMDEVQRELRDIEGTTIIIYEQTCATEKRRRRKRGLMEDIAKRSYINEAVCEGCGDCSAQATCISILPNETELGRKRKIDQSNCNKDFTCVEGFCPSFVTVYGGALRKPQGVTMSEELFACLPSPSAKPLAQACNIMVSGIGGTGVITIGAVLSMAAHIEGRAASVYDMTGLAQKGGAVYSHLKIADKVTDLNAQRIGKCESDLIIGCDLLAATGQDAIQSIDKNRTLVLANSNVNPTIQFQFMPDVNFNTKLAETTLKNAAGEANYIGIEATAIALNLLGDVIATNMMMVGYAFQKGLIPVSAKAIEKAIELNGIAIQFNLNAFNIGRLLAHEPQKVIGLLSQTGKVKSEFKPLENVNEIKAHRVQLLTDYQNAAYADRYITLVEKVITADKALGNENGELSKAVARGFSRLMAYKDEYEVSRLYTNGQFAEQLNNQFEGDIKVKFNLAPPIFGKRDPITGHLIKKEFGSYMMKAFAVLAKFKGLRGGVFDIFGYTAERKMERQLIGEYETLIESLLGKLNDKNYDIAVEIAQTAQKLRGYGHVKENNVEATKKAWVELQKEFEHPKEIIYKQAV